MSDTVQLAIVGLLMALVAAIAPIIIAYAQLRQIKVQIAANTKITEDSAKKIDDSITIIEESAAKVESNTKITEDSAKKIEVVSDRTIQIHSATNGTLSKMETDAKVNAARMESMAAQIASLLQDRADAAKTAEKLALTVAGVIDPAHARTAQDIPAERLDNTKLDKIIDKVDVVSEKVDTAVVVHEEDKVEQDLKNDTFADKPTPPIPPK